MGILRDIWNTIFGIKKEDDKFERGGSIAEPEMKIVHKKSEEKIDAGRTYTENELGEANPACSEDLPKHKPKKRKSKSIVGQKTLNEIKEYLITYGSLDVLTCEQKFKVKSLHNFIWFLRNEGFEIKTDKVSLHNELGQKVEVTNYTLITKK
jgi:hypothetical protein